MADRSRLKVVRVPLGALDAGGGVLSWVNPEEGRAIAIERVEVDVTTKSTAACTLDIGTTATSGATSSNNLLTGLNFLNQLAKVNPAPIDRNRNRLHGQKFAHNNQEIKAFTKKGEQQGRSVGNQRLQEQRTPRLDPELSDELAAFWNEDEVWRVGKATFNERNKPYVFMSLPESAAQK